MTESSTIRVRRRARSRDQVLVALGLSTLVLSASGCDPQAHASKAPRSGGVATVFDSTRDAFSLPIVGLSAAQRAQFFVGNSFFNLNWVSAPSTASERDGLGPLFNARSCSGCHFKDGRGRPPEPGEAFASILMRISMLGAGEHGEPLPDPRYGDQLQGLALPSVAREAHVSVWYSVERGHYADGEAYELARPTYEVTDLGYGALADGIMMSPRVAPAMVGLGLLEAVPEATLRALEDPNDRDGDGVSGRLNRVWDRAKNAYVAGRFGWKAEQPTVRQQVAGAFSGDLGLTTSLYPLELCTSAQTACQASPSGGQPEVSDRTLDSVAVYVRALAVPARRSVDDPQVARGERLFADARCTVCHLPTLTTGPVGDLSVLSNQPIHPYTDLLLHDMGDGLADGRPAFKASGREWRTPPLWGIGLVPKVNGHTRFLHDGRARNLAEAILWHGGEAEASKRAFVRMTREERAALIAFLESL